MRGTLIGYIAGVVTFIGALLAASADAVTLSPAEARGKQIFLTGTGSAGREITAHVGTASTALPASALPCASCHGPDGLGRPEGGVTPANITWTQLSRPYSSVTGVARFRPAYTGDNVPRAIAEGIDAGGVRLDVSMPRYQMHADDMADLIAYLQRLAYELDPGLSETAITIGTLLPQGGQSTSLGQAVRDVLEGYFADLNAGGGIYNRRLELKAAAAPARDLVLERGKSLIESGEVFALVAPFTAGIESELDVAVEQHGIPLVGPFTQFSGGAETMRRFTFYIYGGLGVQAQALAEYASARLVPGGARIGVVHSGAPNIGEIAQSLGTQAQRRQWPAPVVIEYPGRRMNTSAAALAAELKGKNVDVVLFLGPGADLGMLALEAAKLGWTPHLLTPGVMAGSAVFDLPSAFEGRIFLAYPTGPADYTRTGAAAFNEFRKRHGLSRRHTPTQIGAYAAAVLLLEGLKVAGRSLSREKLVVALEAHWGPISSPSISGKKPWPLIANGSPRPSSLSDSG